MVYAEISIALFSDMPKKLVGFMTKYDINRQHIMCKKSTDYKTKLIKPL